ncbi:MAG: hypothetical protein ACKVIS_16450, partial [Pseudomonadales bacterium]
MIRQCIDALRQGLLQLPRRQKRFLQVVTDVALIWLALWLSFALRLGELDAAQPFDGHGWLFLLAP